MAAQPPASKPPLVVYRVQAADGRGPWRHGWSHQWIDTHAPASRPTETLAQLVVRSQLTVRALDTTLHWGCACRTLPALMAWFTPLERHRLQAFGFYPVRLQVDRVLAETPVQLLVGRARPFAEGATRLRWPEGSSMEEQERAPTGEPEHRHRGNGGKHQRRPEGVRTGAGARFRSGTPSLRGESPCPEYRTQAKVSSSLTFRS